MPKITDEELKEMEAGDRHAALIDALKELAPKEDADSAKRHTELVSVLKEISNRPIPEIDAALSKLTDELVGIEKQRTEEITTVVEKIVNGINELKDEMARRPKSFAIQRDNGGFIERIVTEY